MNHLRTSFTLWFFLTILIQGACFSTWWNKKESIADLKGEIKETTLLQKQIRDIEATVHNLSESNRLAHTQANQLIDPQIPILQNIRAQLLPKERQLGLSNIIQALNTESRRLALPRIKEFLANEVLYEKQKSEHLAQFEKQQDYVIILWAILSSIILFITWISLRMNVFSPLQRLSQKMADFVNGKYSYQFEVPSNDEVGQLHMSFNSMAQQVLRNLEELKQLDQAKTEFLNIASHELRTPMTSIKGSLGLMSQGLSGELPTDAKQLIHIAESETDRLIRLINDILDMAKIEAGRVSLHKKWASVNDVIQKTCDGLRGFATQSQVHMEIVIDNHYEAFIDPDRVQQVLTNLVSNAIKFSPTKGTVWIRCEMNYDHHLSIEVIDQGRGISPEDQSQIFQKFRQATAPQNPLVKGTGLGLSIAKALVEQHGGQIGVTSNPGQGSHFWFTLVEVRQTVAADKTEISSIDFQAERSVA